MTETHDSCNICGDSKVIRIPSTLRDAYVSAPSKKVGNIVQSTIKETKKEVEEYKKELRKGIEK